MAFSLSRRDPTTTPPAPAEAFTNYAFDPRGLTIPNLADSLETMCGEAWLLGALLLWGPSDPAVIAPLDVQALARALEQSADTAQPVDQRLLALGRAIQLARRDRPDEAAGRWRRGLHPQAALPVERRLVAILQQLSDAQPATAEYVFCVYAIKSLRLCETDGAREALLEAAALPDEERRLAALEGLSEGFAAASVGDVAVFQEDPRPAIRREVLRLAAAAGGPGAVALLARGRRDADLALAREAVEGLADTQGAEAIAALEAALKDPRPELRVAAAEALFRHDRCTGLAVLVDEVRQRRAGAYERLCRYAGRDFGVAPERFAPAFQRKVMERIEAWQVSHGGGDALSLLREGLAHQGLKLGDLRQASDLYVLLDAAATDSPYVQESAVRRFLRLTGQEREGRWFFHLGRAAGDITLLEPRPEDGFKDGEKRRELKAQQAEALARWRTWLDERAAKLHYDEIQGRFIVSKSE